MKNKIKLFSIFVSIYFILSFLSLNNVYAGNLRMNNLDFNVVVNEDASMDVTEKWRIRIDETNTLFKSFDIDKTKFSDIDNVSVKDLTNNVEFKKFTQYSYHVPKNFFYALDMKNSTYEIAWGIGMDETSGIREYEIKYTVNDAIAIHNDCAELYWQFIGKNFEVPIEKITGTISLPGNLQKEDIKVWGHTNTLNGIINPTSESSIEFLLENIPSREFVEIRAAFPKDSILFSNRMDSKDVLNDIIEEETDWANDANSRREARKKFNNMIILCIGVACAMLIFIELRQPIKIILNAEPKIVPIGKQKEYYLQFIMTIIENYQEKMQHLVKL